MDSSRLPGIQEQLLPSSALSWVLASLLISTQLQDGLFLQKPTCIALIPAEMFPTLPEGPLNKKLERGSGRRCLALFFQYSTY